LLYAAFAGEANPIGARASRAPAERCGL